jgi:hypothetical protein
LLSYPCTGAGGLLQRNINAREQNESGATKKCRQERRALEDGRNFIISRRALARPKAVAM